MANSPSSKKRALQAERRAEINKARRSRMRTFVRKVEEAHRRRRARRRRRGAARRAARDHAQRLAAASLHKNTASRKISRLAGRVKALGA